jgi:hypothetical protein
MKSCTQTPPSLRSKLVLSFVGPHVCHRLRNSGRAESRVGRHGNAVPVAGGEMCETGADFYGDHGRALFSGTQLPRAFDD